METKLKNGINSLIAYYFKTTGFYFIDEYDLSILINLSKQAGIDIDESQNNLEEILSNFTSLIAKFFSQECDKENAKKSLSITSIWNNEKHEVEYIQKLNFFYYFYKPVLDGKKIKFVVNPNLEKSFDELIGEDLSILSSKLPNDEMLKKYLTLKKIILCKTTNPFDEIFRSNVASINHSDSFNSLGYLNDENGEIDNEIYEFINEVEDAFQNGEEKKDKKHKKQLVLENSSNKSKK